MHGQDVGMMGQPVQQGIGETATVPGALKIFLGV